MRKYQEVEARASIIAAELIQLQNQSKRILPRSEQLIDSLLLSTMTLLLLLGDDTRPQQRKRTFESKQRLQSQLQLKGRCVHRAVRKRKLHHQ
jgi:hypothetical protein